MERVLRTSKLLVVADESGNIVSAAWPGVQSEGAPPQTGVVLSEGRVAHEVDLPDELYEAARPDLSGYRLRIDAGGSAAIERSPGA
ncbi:hypothetical protein [Streptomyces sp. R35]|uniref:Uncharacterized protein n=1 Tax=Streptomyces sp. R35 TaxID=3238630 RepID=A0AB39RWF3_9ACTN